ncbi:MAG: transcription antitermination factor NusB [Bacteroidales bacterium]|nr:transcription antitermination factor NusB [Bacteroidales bacterium]
MLSRRHLRIKVLQALYAFLLSVNDRLDLGEKELFRSLDKLYEIYIYQLSLLIEIIEFARKRIEENKQKFFPTEDDLDPNTRFVENSFIHQIETNRELLRKIDLYKISWYDSEDLIRKLLVTIRESDEFKEYMQDAKPTYEKDKEIFFRIVKKYISRSELLQFYYEERSIYWYDDFNVANLLVLKTIKSYKESWDEFHKFPEFFKNEGDEVINEDKQFVKDLFRKTIIHSDEYNNIIEEKVKNWEMDRIAVMDILLIKMAMVELMEMPSIPIKVTLNEYIELAKLYSTPKSKIFVNGILDKLIVDLKNQNRIKKVGRGLMEN